MTAAGGRQDETDMRPTRPGPITSLALVALGMVGVAGLRLTLEPTPRGLATCLVATYLAAWGSYPLLYRRPKRRGGVVFRARAGHDRAVVDVQTGGARSS